MLNLRNLVSPRSRAPIVFGSDDEDYEDDRCRDQTQSAPLSREPRSILRKQRSLALPRSHSVSVASSPTTNYGPIMSTAPTIRMMESDLFARTSAAQNRLEEETAAYKRRLESYRQAQHQQALLVARLQSKLLQYKQRCSTLETKLGQETPIVEAAPRGPPNDLEEALWRLEQEKIRNENLLHLNRDLRYELDETRKINDTLSNDLQRLSDDWENLTRQMTEKEQMWKAEEQAYSDYYALEHTKLINLWKQVSTTKREFAEMKSSTGRDMAQLKNSLARMSNQISSGVITAAVASPSPQQEAQQAAFIAQLTQEIHSAQNTHDNLRRQLKDRDDKIASLDSTIVELENKMGKLDSEINRISNQELGLLNNSLKEIAKLLLTDFEQHGISEDGHELHLTSAPAIFIYDDNGENPTVFAESVVSAVQAALNKRQLQIHQLQVNLSSSKEQAMVSRGHVETLESELHKAEEKLGQLVEINEKLKDELEHVRMEKDTATRALENLKNEKNILEAQRKTLANELESTQKVKTNMAQGLTRLEKSLETSRDEISVLTLELDKVRDELTSAVSQLKLERDLNTKVREQLTSISEDKEKNASENKTLKNQLNELITKYEDLTFQFERSEDTLKKWKMDAEILAEKLRSSSERSEAMEKDKKKWLDKARQLEDAKNQFETDLTDARNDLASLRRELLDSERIRTDLESKVEKLISTADGAESKKSILESQLESQREEYIREINLLTERIDMLTEELNQTRREYDETFQILDKTKSDLHEQEKLHMEAAQIVDNKDNLIKNLSNAMEKLREEKYSFEELEQTLKSGLIEKDKKIDSLAKQGNEVKSKLTSELNILKEKLSRAESEVKSVREKAEQEKGAIESKFSKEIANVRSQYGSTEDKIRSDYEDKLKTLRNELETDKKNEVTRLTNEINLLKQQIDSLRVQYEEALLRAENDKQQGLLLAQQDQQGLSDKIRLLERELDDLKTEKDRVKRECEAKCNHEKNAAASLRSEIIKLKNELENTRQDNIDSQKTVESRLTDIEREREAALMQVEELRNKLRSTEEREAEIKRELNDVHRKLRDTEASGDHCRQELTETRRSLTELSVEKEKSSSANEQLKEELNRRETELNTLRKEFNKTQNHVKNLERFKSELEAELSTLGLKLESATRDKSELAKQYEEFADALSQSKSYSTKLESEIGELKVKLEAESERRDEAEASWRNTKKILDETEAKLNILRQEEERLSLRLSEAEEKYSHRESQLLNQADENKHREKKLLEEKHNLNVCLVTVQQQMEQISAKLSSAEHRNKALGEEKLELEKQKKESESKLNLIQSGLKRLGILQGSSGSITENPEAVRRAMNVLSSQMASLQQDRDTMASQLNSARDTINALEMTKTHLEDQLSQLSRNVQGVKGENKAKDSIIFNIEKDLALKSGEISRLADKIREMEDVVKSRDENIRSLRLERESMKDELDKARGKLDDMRTQGDSKWAKAEVQIRALEGDLNRATLVLQQKESHIQSMEDKIALMQRNNSELEERCSSLTMTVEQLNISLEKAGHLEQDWKDRYHSATRTSSENSAQLNALHEKLRSLQREKAMLEQEKNSLNEKWEASSVTLQDFKRQVQVLAEKNQKLRLQTEDMTRAAIDKQLKMTFAESGKEELRQIMGDKLELQRKVDTLLDKIRDLERENRELERLKDSVPMKGVVARSPMMRDNAVTVLEEENSELRRKVSKLEAEIRDLERRHVKHIAEVTTQVKQERDFELERSRAGKLQAERLLEAREGNYRQQIQRLEQQVTNLKEQLGEEIRRRQTFLSRSFRTGQEIRNLRQALGDSLRNVSMDPNTMESETRRLDTTLDLHKSGSQSSLYGASPMRERDLSPGYGLGGSGASGLKSSTPTPK